MGQVYLVKSFAGVQVKLEVSRKEVCPFTKEDIWWGVLIDEKDAKALQSGGVPYSRINIDESIIFDWQIVKLIRGKNKNATTLRKRRKRLPTLDTV